MIGFAPGFKTTEGPDCKLPFGRHKFARAGNSALKMTVCLMLRHDFSNPLRQEADWMLLFQPGTRLILALGGTFLIAFLNELGLLAGIAFAAGILLAWRGCSWKWIGSRLMGLGVLVFLFAVPLAWLGPGYPSGFLRTKPEGIRLGSEIIFKAVAILCWNWLWLLGFGSRLWRLGAKQIHLPGGLAESGWLMGTSIGLIRKEMRQMRMALRLRGGRITPNFQGYHLLANLLGMTLWRSSGHSERISVTRALRCQGPGEKAPPLDWFQLVAMGLVFLPLVAMFYFNRFPSVSGN